MLWSYYGREKKVVIPEAVTSIGAKAFYMSYSMCEVTIPDSVVSIGNHAFHDCSAIKKLTIPQNVKCIDNNAFQGCKGLADPNGFLIINNVLYGYFKTPVELTIPDGVTAIGELAFYNRIIKNVIIPEGVTFIGKQAFMCSTISCITLPESVTFIGRNAFESDTVLAVRSGSYAEQYAKENDRKYLVV